VDCSTWALQQLLLFSFTMRWGPYILVHCNVVSIRFSSPFLKKALEVVSCSSQTCIAHENHVMYLVSKCCSGNLICHILIAFFWIIFCASIIAVCFILKHTPQLKNGQVQIWQIRPQSLAYSITKNC